MPCDWYGVVIIARSSLNTYDGTNGLFGFAIFWLARSSRAVRPKLAFIVVRVPALLLWTKKAR